MVLALIVVMSLIRLYWLRRAVWGVINVGGAATVVSPPIRGRRTVQGNSLPSFVIPAFQWFHSVRSLYPPPDNQIFGVNLATANVDHRWLRHLTPLTGLEVISLDQRQIGSETGALASLPKLREVSVFNVGAATDLQHLTKIPKLQKLRLVLLEDSVTGFDALGQLPALRELELEALRNESPEWALLLKQCAGWSNVETILIRSNHSLARGLESLSRCESLKSLEISAPLTHLDIAGLSQIHQLTSLVVNAKNVPNKDWMMLGQLGNLRSLKIYSNGAEPLSIESLREKLRDCEIEGEP